MNCLLSLLALLCFALHRVALLCFALLRFALRCVTLLCFALLCFALLCFALLAPGQLGEPPTPSCRSKLGEPPGVGNTARHLRQTVSYRQSVVRGKHNVPSDPPTNTKYHIHLTRMGVNDTRKTRQVTTTHVPSDPPTKTKYCIHLCTRESQ